MKHETPSDRFEHWESLIASVARDLEKVNQLVDVCKHARDNWERVSSESKNFIENWERALSERKNLIDRLSLGSVRSVSERLDLIFAEIQVARDRQNAACEEYEALLREDIELQLYVVEQGLKLEKELTDTRVTMELVLFAIELGKTVAGQAARSHIIRYVTRHSDASCAEICAYLDSKDIPLPTEKWKAVVEHKYGCARWKYSLEGNTEKGISADKKMAHRTRQYLWRYGKMANDLLALYKIKCMLKLRKLQLPEIAA